MTWIVFLFTLFSSVNADIKAPYENKQKTVFTAGNSSLTYPDNYEYARTSFRAAADDVLLKRPSAQLGSYKIPNKKNDDLTIDHLYIPFDKSRKILIITSGIHGPEAFAGHVIELSFIRRVLLNPADYPFNILIIHSMNPYGFKNFRRTNENNVDLNRNFAEPADFVSDNKSYNKLRYLFNPTGSASVSLISKAKFFLKAGLSYMIRGKKNMLSGIAGQYKDPTGPFYGGNTLQTETIAVQYFIKKYASFMDDIYHVDLHTGFGEKNHLHFFGVEEPQNAAQMAAMRKMFATYTVVTGRDKDFYPTTGDMVAWTLKSFQGKIVVPMVFEFGTMDSQTVKGGLMSMWITSLENQGKQRGYVTEDDELTTRDYYESLFNPQDEEWQRALVTQSEEALTTTLKRFQAL